MSTPRPSMETREEVMFFDTDCGGVVHNLAYLRMIETCRTRLAALMGMDLRTMSDTHVFPVVTRTKSITNARPNSATGSSSVAAWTNSRAPAFGVPLR